MATPNIVNVATINAKNATALLDGTSRTEAVDVPADKVAKINTILVANVDGTNACIHATEGGEFGFRQPYVKRTVIIDDGRPSPCWS